MKCFKNVQAYVEGKGVVNADICFNERIISTEKAEGEQVILPQNSIVVPGFIDLHIHGAGGSDTMDGNAQALQTISKTVAQEGTVGFLATTMTQSEENIEKALTAVKEFEDTDGARVLGVHLEGPFISPEYAGAQPREYIVKPNAKQFIKYNKASGNRIKKVTVAPEEEGAEELIKYLKDNGITASVGHSNANAEEVKRAVIWGAESVTHTFNAQSPFKHRDIGVAGAQCCMTSSAAR